MNRGLLIVFLGTCCCIAGCGRMKWREFNCLDGRFSVQMPGDPKMETNRIKGILLVEYSVDLGSMRFTVRYADGAEPAKDLSKFYDDSPSENLGNVTKRQDWALNGVNGKEFELRLWSEKGRHLSSRLIIIGTRFYSLSVTGKDATLENPDVKKFFESFKIRK